MRGLIIIMVLALSLLFMPSFSNGVIAMTAEKFASAE